MIKKLLVKYFLLTALVFGLLVRLVSLNQSLWMDEAISAVAAKDFSYTGIVNNFILSDTHPPLHYLVLKFWTSIFGYSEISLRLPSLIFGFLTIFVVFKIGEMLGRKTAVFAALLTAFSPLLIYYSQEARMYSLTTLLVSLIMYFFFTKKWFWYSLTLPILLITDYLPLFILIPIGFLLVFTPGLKNNFKSIILSHVPFMVSAILAFPLFNAQRLSTTAYLSSNDWWGSLLGVSNLKSLALVWVKFLIGRINFMPIYVYGVVIVVTSILVITALIVSFKHFKKTYPFWLWWLVPIATSFILLFGLPGFSYFRLIFTLPALLIIISCGFSKIKFGSLFFVVFLILQIFFSSIYLFNKNYWREDWKSAVNFIESNVKSDEFVYISYKESFTPYSWYAKKPEIVKSFMLDQVGGKSLYSLDYLMDATDPTRAYYAKLRELGYKNTGVYNFRGVGQVRYWVKI